MKLIIAEKPSVAHGISKVLGVTGKKEGYLEGNGYFITWALGHLVSLALPRHYGIQGFKAENLPIIPAPFILTPRFIKKGKEYEADPGALKQLTVIKQLMDRSDSLIAATDAGREGELIYRYIYEYLKCTKPAKRLWISSLTESAIKKGFDSLKPASDFEGLYQAAETRSRSDWLVGINASQALSISAGDSIYSLGRVQTPTLGLICTRWQENKDFAVKKYWQIRIEHRKEYTDFKSTSEDKWEDKGLADKALQSIARQKTAAVAKVEKNTRQEQPPLLFDLTGLQKEANKIYHLSADETLKIAQSLYEQKFITYPRTGSKHITEDLWEEIPGLIHALEDKEGFKEPVSKTQWGNLNNYIVNSLKVTDHHGLLTTEKIPSTLSARENSVYNLIALRLLEAVSSACIKEITTVRLEVLHFGFAAKGCKILKPGWRGIKGNYSEDEKEELEQIPELTEGEELKIKNSEIVEKKTVPPALYTEATLLGAMENAGKKMEDSEARKALASIGIGTPATRASIIEILFSRGYIQKNKQSLVPTEKGLHTYGLVKEMKISDVAMTAEWELALQKIEDGERDAADFEKEITAYVIEITEELLTLPRAATADLICPKCKKSQLMIRENVISCPDTVCDWKLFRTVCGIHLSMDEVKKLISTGKTSLIKGFTAKTHKKFDAFIVLNEKAETVFEFPPNKSSKKR